MNTSLQISSRQMLSTLLLCRLFILMVFIPTTHSTVSTYSALAVIVLGAALTMAAVVPMVLLHAQYPGRSLLDCVGLLAPRWQRPAVVLFLFLCLAIAAESAGQFAYFTTTAVYPQAQENLVTLLFCLTVWYMVSMGLQGLVRASTVVLALVVATFGFIFIHSVGQVDLLNLISPWYDGWGELGYGSVLYLAQNIELVLLLLLFPYTRQQGAGALLRGFAWYNGIVVLVLEVVSFFTLTVMGTYGQTRIFPVYTLSAVADARFFYRLDYFYILIWSFVALSRSAVYLYMAVQLLRLLFPPEKPVKSSYLNLIAAVALFFCTMVGGKNSFRWIYRVIASGWPVFLLVTVLPTLLLGVNFHKKKGETCQ